MLDGVVVVRKRPVSPVDTSSRNVVNVSTIPLCTTSTPKSFMPNNWGTCGSNVLFDHRTQKPTTNVFRSARVQGWPVNGFEASYDILADAVKLEQIIGVRKVTAGHRRAIDYCRIETPSAIRGRILA